MPTRRTFLGLLTAVPAFGQLPVLERKGAAQHIVILGGGLAGLCSAYELLAQGHRVTLLEAQLRPGGRVRTLRENLAPGLYVEAGPEAIPGAHEITLHYAKTLGVPSSRTTSPECAAATTFGARVSRPMRRPSGRSN
jgi:monoamine oxidase